MPAGKKSFVQPPAAPLVRELSGPHVQPPARLIHRKNGSGKGIQSCQSGRQDQLEYALL
ncbi:MAG: hypothetical protein JWQ08_2204 [Deinococcus sp.]|nr:hypothetical protein [Deinococcus sp.]